MSTRLISYFLLLVIFIACPRFATATAVQTPHVEAELIARTTAIQPGQPLEAALRLKIIDHWHTYWRNPGDSGLPTKLSWSLPAGFVAEAIEWPYPKKLPLGPLMNFGYEGEVLHLVTIRTPAGLKPGDRISLKAKADWLVCNDVCIPESADLMLTLPVVAAPGSADNRWTNAFALARASLPKELPVGKNTAALNNGNLTIALSTAPDPVPAGEIAFYPFADELIANAGKQTRTNGADETRVELNIPLAENMVKAPKSIEGVLVSSAGWGKIHNGNAIAVSLPVASTSPVASLRKTASATSASDMGLALALAFALLGGMVLNLMPCVFPVLGIKVMSFAQHARSEPKLLRKQGLAFLGGVLVSFWTLAAALIILRAAGEAVGWGFQLQSPLFVTLLAALFFLMALNLCGVFEMGLGLQTAAGQIAAGSNRGALLDAFLSGVLATIVATPCTAPMMGAALGFTLSQPPYVGMLVFTAIGIGMALPVLTLSFFPDWLRRMPKPGQWMLTFRQLMAFPLFATVVWLAWVLGSQLGNDAIARLLFGLVLVAIGTWIYGHWQAARPVLAILAGAIVVISGLAVAWPGALNEASQGVKVTDDWVPFSRQKIAELRGKNKAVFIDFTATWCITCQVNKRVALNNADVLARFAALGIVRVKADWTLKDPEITAALAEFGRNGVPLYVYYPAGGPEQVLPEILTPAIVLAAMDAGANPVVAGK